VIVVIYYKIILVNINNILKFSLITRQVFRRKSHDGAFVDAFRTNQCGSSSGQIEESNLACILNSQSIASNG